LPKKICDGFSEKKFDFLLLIGAIVSKLDICAFWPKIAPSVKVTQLARGDLAVARPPRELWSDPCGARLAAGLKPLRLPRARVYMNSLRIGVAGERTSRTQNTRHCLT